MSVAKVAIRYAKSLVSLAQEHNKLDRVMEDVDSFKEVVSNRDFYLFIKSPVIHPTKKESIVNQLFEGKYDELTMAFLRILIKKGRESYLPEIAVKFLEEYRSVKNITTVRLTTATKLDQSMIDLIIGKLSESKVTDQNIELEVKVDEELIGGFILEFDDKMFDASVKNKLEELKKTFRDNLYISQIIAR